MSSQRRMIVGISGATGIVYGARILEMLRAAGVQTHLVVSRAAQVTRACETELGRKDLESLADVVHAPGDVTAAIASGSFRTAGMIVAPCSVSPCAIAESTASSGRRSASVGSVTIGTIALPSTGGYKIKFGTPVSMGSAHQAATAGSGATMSRPAGQPWMARETVT